MDRNEADNLGDHCWNRVPKDKRGGKEEIEWFIEWLYDNNYEIVDRSIPEEHIREMTNEKE